MNMPMSMARGRSLNDHLFRDFENFFNLQSGVKFPLYNVKVYDDQMCVDLALAGFSKDQLDIEFDNSILHVKGAKSNKDDDSVKYIKKQISEKSFEVSYRIPVEYDLEEARFENGILSIIFKQNPKDVKKIEIK